LDNLNAIGGSLWIASNASLSNLAGLEGLNDIATDLKIQGNAQLLSLAGIEGLNAIPGDLSIYSNTLLTSLDALQNITSIGGNFQCAFNVELNTLSGLDNLTYIGGNLIIGAFIWASSSLTTLEGLGNLSEIGGSFTLHGDNGLTSLDGLRSLHSIGSHIELMYNYSLTSLAGLEGLTSIGMGIIVSDNQVLENLTGLDNIEPETIKYLHVDGNSSLSHCHVQSICDYLVIPNGSFTISNNAPGCNSPEEVIEACIISVEEITPPESFSVFPNPANDRLTIQLLLEKPEPVRIAILNAAGQQMALLADDQPKAGEYRTEIDISKWPSGVYLCRVLVGKEIFTQKIIKVQ
jgi:hypothetical protein